jgi:serine/threonine protein kinase
MSELKEKTLFADRYTLLKLIGTGGFAEVWKASDRLLDEEVVALKIFVEDLDQEKLKSVKREIRNLRMVTDPHVLKPGDIFIWEGTPYLKMDYCEGGDLYNQLQDRLEVTGKAFSEREVALVMQQISGALADVHRKKLVHLDVKPDNILVKQPGHYVLTDFGISVKTRSTVRRTLRLEQAEGQKETAYVTPDYAPPEVLHARPRPSHDIFSLGVTLYELAFGRPPYDETGLKALPNGMNIPGLPDPYSETFSAILQACMNREPRDRPRAFQLRKWATHFLEQEGDWGIQFRDEIDEKGHQKVTIEELGEPAKELPDPSDLRSIPFLQIRSVTPSACQQNHYRLNLSLTYDNLPPASQVEVVVEDQVVGKAAEPGRSGKGILVITDPIRCDRGGKVEARVAREPGIRDEKGYRLPEADQVPASATGSPGEASQGIRIPGGSAREIALGKNKTNKLPANRSLLKVGLAIAVLVMVTFAIVLGWPYLVSGPAEPANFQTSAYAYEGERDYYQVPAGEGKATYPNGVVYSGTFRKGLPEGEGVLVFPNGDAFEGRFEAGRMVEGTYRFAGGAASYQGDFEDGKPHGQQSTYVFSDGTRYEGAFENGKPQGEGSYFFPDNSIYLGQFRKGKPLGEGKYLKPNREIVKSGRYLNDRFLEDQ